MMNDEDIKKLYEHIKEKNKKDYENKLNIIYSEHKDLQRLDKQIIDLKIKNIAAYTTNNYEIEENNKILQSLIAQKNELIKIYNIPSDYRERKYLCEKCKDTGFVNGKKCDCYTKYENRLFNKLYKTNAIIENKCFDKLDVSYYDQKDEIAPTGDTYLNYIKMMFNHIKEQIENIENKPYNALFLGKPGTGKTEFAMCIAHEMLKKNLSVLFLSAIDLLNSYFEMDKTDDMEQHVLFADFLVIDGLGMENQNEFFTAKIFNIIDKRLNDNKSTIITTNLSIGEIKQKYNDAIASRLRTYNKYKTQGKDFRGV